MKYFLHDTDSIEDEKMTELFMHFGYEGVGLFYVALEKIGKQEKPIKTEVLKTQLKVTKRLEKCWSFIQSLGLLSATNGEIFNERILSYSQKYQIKKEKNREKISEWRENKRIEENVTSYEPVRNSPKVKESKVKVSKGNSRANALVGSDEPTPDFQKNLSKEYYDIIARMTGFDNVQIWEQIKNFIVTNHPGFINPYVDLWNVFARRLKLAEVASISESRKNKFSTRIREEPFDFIAILSAIKKSTHLKGENDRGWKVTFDWIIENDKNYLKIIEGQYN